MQHLGPEIGELRRLGVRQAGDRPGPRHHARVGGEHAAHVRPDLNLPRVERGANQGRGVVGPASPERGRYAVHRRGDVAAQDGNESVVEQRGERGAGALERDGQERFGAAMCCISGETVARVDVAPCHARPSQRRREERRRESLAVRRNLVPQCRSPVWLLLDVVEQPGDLAPRRLQSPEQCLPCLRPHELVGDARMPLEQGVEARRGAAGVAGRRRIRRREQRVSGAGERGDDHHGPRSAMLADYARHALHGGRVGHRGPSEFEDPRM